MIPVPSILELLGFDQTFRDLKPWGLQFCFHNFTMRSTRYVGRFDLLGVDELAGAI